MIKNKILQVKRKPVLWKKREVKRERLKAK